jgi:3-oxoacyl-[acyl-carrier protein] reductase
MGEGSGGARPWILITGGSRGIGRGLVTGFADAGYDVEFTYRSNAEAAEETARAAAGAGDVRGHCCDSADQAAVDSLAATLIAEKGAPFAIVGNAGVTRDALLVNMTSAQWNEVIGANLNGAYFIARAFTQAMVEAGQGSILLMSSVAGQRGVAGQSNYASTKAALSGLARALAVELGRFGLRVNAIAPGYIATDMLGNFADAQRRSIERAIPLRRIGTVEDVVSVARFLISEQARYITGQTIVVDGGLTA